MSNSNTTTRLCLDLPAEDAAQTDSIPKQLAFLSAHLDIACIKLPPEDSDIERNYTTKTRALITMLQEKGIAVIADLTTQGPVDQRKSFEKALEKTVRARLDGIHMGDDTELFARAREVLGEDAIIGCDCRASKHQAMLLGEAGADYIAPGSLSEGQEGPERETGSEDLICWWQQLFEVPCVAGPVADRARLEALLEIPADFVLLSPELWQQLYEDRDFLSMLAAHCPPLAAIDQGGSACAPDSL